MGAFFAGSPHSKQKGDLMKQERGIYKRGKFYWLRFMTPEGEARESTKQTSLKLARQALAQRQVEVAEGKYFNRRTKLTFTELADRYWERKGNQLRYNGLVCMLNRWKKHFTDKSVATIKRTHIEGYLTTLKGKAVSTQNKHLTMLRAMFNWAIDEELIQGNPTARIKKLKGETKRVKWLTVEEMISDN